MSSILLSLEKVSSRRWDRVVLQDLSWSFHKGESWAVIGSNGAGKSTLVGLILDQIPYFQGSILRSGLKSGLKGIVKVSFEVQQKIIAHEARKERYEAFSGIEEHLLTVSDLLKAESAFKEETEFNQEAQNLIQESGLETLLNRPAQKLSNGEMRKTLLVQALLQNPELLILDEPFEGLDQDSLQSFSSLISLVIQKGTPLILITHRFNELVPEISHILCLKNGKLFAQGKREAMLKIAHNGSLYGADLKLPSFLEKVDATSQNGNSNLNSTPHKIQTPNETPVIEMQNVRVSYEDKVILNNFDWTVRQGENWKILGPNGAGKSTLLSLISGDHLQAYANQIRVFGSPRGEGESIWELKQKIGTITAELQVGYRQPISALKVVLSGFFDSIGLYRPASDEQKAIAGKWLQTLNLEYLAENDFLKLSYGQQRMILIARAMVKSPSLLILDEPCQGLDPHNRNQILKVIDLIGSGTPTQILYVTHSPEDHLNCLDYELRFLKQEDGTYKVRKTKLKSLQ